jgi:RNA polymerase sigma-70 factor (ECF subfamily)
MNAFATSWTGTRSTRRPFADVAEDCLDDVRRFLVFFTGDVALADDLTAETFERALRRWKRYDPRRGPELPWLCAIARRVALDHFRSESRRRGREQRYAAEETHVEDLEPVGFSPELAAALATLSAGEREVIVLRIVLEMDADTAARVLGIGRTACSMRLSRALGKLGERMESHAIA